MMTPRPSADDGHPLAARIRDERAMGEATLAALIGEAARQGVMFPVPDWEAAQFSLQRDPFSGEESLQVRWAGQPRGQLTLRPQGWVYGELDVCVPHPQKPGQWIEAITAWGQAPRLKVEARLLDVPQ